MKAFKAFIDHRWIRQGILLSLREIIKSDPRNIVNKVNTAGGGGVEQASGQANVQHAENPHKGEILRRKYKQKYCSTISLDSFQRLILHLNILLHEHFQVKSESIDTETIPISLKLSPAQPGPLDHFLFHQLSTASAKQKCFLSLHSLKYDKKITFTPGFASSTHS